MADTDPTTPAPTTWPCLSYEDAKAGIAFLVEAFGFEERLVIPGDERREIAHAELVWPPGGGVMLGSRDPEGTEFARVPAGVGNVYCVCPDPDALHDRAVAAGAEVVAELHDTDYGSRDVSLRDPEGNLWTFGTYPGSPRT